MKFHSILSVLFFGLTLYGCASTKRTDFSQNLQDSSWQGKEKLNPWKNYSEHCRISRRLFKETGKDLDYYICTDEKNKLIYLSFEDSQTVSDWLYDFAFFARSYEHGNFRIKAHGGFISVWKSGCSVIMEELFEVAKNNPDYEFVITGWSMGGALAHLAAEEFNFRTRTEPSLPDSGKKAVLITYGTPYLLWGKETRSYFEKCVKASYNFAHKKDIFAKLPPASWNYFVINRIEIGQDDPGGKDSHLRYADKNLYSKVFIDDSYMQSPVDSQ